MIKNWSNTTLVAYSSLPKFVRELDNAIKMRINSTYQSRHLKIGVSNEQLIGEICDLITEKRKLCTLENAIRLSLDKLSEQDREILILRNVKKLTLERISYAMNIPMRTLFRRLEIAQAAFAAHMRALDYTEETLEQDFGKDMYLSHIHNRLALDKHASTKSM